MSFVVLPLQSCLGWMTRTCCLYSWKLRPIHSYRQLCCSTSDSLQTVIRSTISNGKLSPSIFRNVEFKPWLYFSLFEQMICLLQVRTHVLRETRDVQNQWCQTHVISIALSSNQVHPGCGLCMVVLGPTVEWVSVDLWLSSSPGAQWKCQYLQLGKGNLTGEAALQNPKAPPAPRWWHELTSWCCQCLPLLHQVFAWFFQY